METPSLAQGMSMARRSRLTQAPGAAAGKTLHGLEDVDALARQETNFSIRMETKELRHFGRESLLNEPRR